MTIVDIALFGGMRRQGSPERAVRARTHGNGDTGLYRRKWRCWPISLKRAMADPESISLCVGVVHPGGHVFYSDSGSRRNAAPHSNYGDAISD